MLYFFLFFDLQRVELSEKKLSDIIRFRTNKLSDKGKFDCPKVFDFDVECTEAVVSM